MSMTGKNINTYISDCYHRHGFSRKKRILHATYTGSSLYYVSKGTGWVGSENGNFAAFSLVYAEAGWVYGSEKVQKCDDVV